MKRMLVVLLLVTSSTTAARNSQPSGQTSLVFTDISVIDATGAATKPHMMVIVSGEKIARIEPYRKDRVPADAQTIDGHDKFVIPGLWDMHVHWYDERYLPLFVANGVTGIRQMAGAKVLQGWRSRIADGSLLSPRMFVASSVIDGPKPVVPGTMAVSDAAEGRAVVITARKDGADFIKVYSLLPRDAYFAIADQAKKEGMPFVGHVPNAVSLKEASNAGQKSVEHLTGIMLAASSHEDEFRKELLQAPSSRELATEIPAVSVDRAAQLLDTFDQKKAASVYQQLAKNHTWQVPTLTVLRAMAYLDDPSVTSDKRLRYMPRSFRTQWDPQSDGRFKTSTVQDWAHRKKQYDKDLQIVGDMRRRHVDLLAGTDAGNPFCFPGFSLHDELGLLVKAGLTPMEALQAATRNAAKYLNILDSSGTVEPGKIADLVILDADPLRDIDNTKKIAGVMMRGTYFSAPALDRMLANVEAMANRKSIAETLTKTITESGIVAALQQYRRLKTEDEASYEFREAELNGLGYRLLQAKRVRDAIEIFKLNVEMYPRSANAYDSLADGYMNNGEKELSIANYRRSLVLDPSNQNAKTQIEKLQRD